jgi:hypothetical protein
MKKGTYPHFFTSETSHKKLKTPKMTRRKLKIPKLQNTKTKNFQSSQEERKISPLPPCETSHNVF